MLEPKEQLGHEEKVRVAVDGGNRLGNLIDKPGQSYRLSNTFGEMAKYLGSDRFSEVYFRTESDNIYLITDRGEIVNLRESQKKGEPLIYKMSETERKMLEMDNLTVGKSFKYGDNHITTRIVEIVPVTPKRYIEDYIKETTQGRISTIVDEFKDGMPPEKPSSFPGSLPRFSRPKF